MPLVPKHIPERELIRDPHNRPGHWYHPATDTVLHLGTNYRPTTAASDSPASDVEKTDDFTGRRVAILQGRFEGKHATISEPGRSATGDEDDPSPFRVILDESGQELPIERFDGWLRFLTAEEIAADEEALAAKQEGSDAGTATKKPAAAKKPDATPGA